ncbi:MAG: thioesterase family protein [Burkholderiales bacterium]
MKDSLQAGLTYQFKFTVPPSKTVPHLYPESALFQQMPDVLATGYLVGLLEWACIEAIKPHLDWPREQSLGTHVNFSHIAATPAGMTITVDVRLDKVEGRKLTFTLSAHDGVDQISEGTHERHVIDVERFNAKLAAKVEKLKAEKKGRQGRSKDAKDAE